MKLVFIFFILFSSFSFGQFFENFDHYRDLSKLPEDWIAFKGDNKAGDDFNNWKLVNLDEEGSDRCLFVRYENSGKLNEDWIVSPKIDLSNYENNYLTFSQRNSFIDNSTKYEIKISTHSQIDRDKFQTIESYDDSTFGQSFTIKKIDISKYNRKHIYIAFVKQDDDGNNWFIDNVSVQGKPLDKNSVKNMTSFYPNPTSGKVYGTEKVKKLQVINANNKIIKVYFNPEFIDISDLPAGIYFLKGAYEDAAVFTQKIIKEN
ncbi:T9SS-dependent choice-of-anchor J family protein [Chryseobacterium indologenes]|uniref:Secretion system C-terminal sorting domain-containing protein n=1 Tax=Chryseobacterium indologenes TaxID=253 RepID=A0A0N1KRJ3_CHRID|nr:choice-of-anchor J domain-containing protein [Chryseobacterium indologenes]KPE49509.1 hypothetical protein AOB46_19365 [Chryseobacterium indologenes]